MKIELRTFISWFAVMAALMVVTGCAGPNGGGASVQSGGDDEESLLSGSGYTSDTIRVGDMLNIRFSGTSTIAVPDHDEQVPEDGYITLQQIGEVKVVGKSRVELQKEIRDLYVPKYFRNLNVTIAPDQRFFYVYGEVNKPDRHFYAGELTVLGAISTAGDFTDFANPKKVKLIRADGIVEVINCVEASDNPLKNVQVLPGDTIRVPRRFW